jgi:hypothetical protein
MVKEWYPEDCIRATGRKQFLWPMQTLILVQFIKTNYHSPPCSAEVVNKWGLYLHWYRLCGLVVRGPGFDSRALLRIFLRELGLERGPLSLVIG